MSKPGYDYKQICVLLLENADVPPVQEAAVAYAEEGWRTVSCWPAHEPNVVNMLLERPLQTQNMDHNHPLGVSCGDDCPVLIQWSNLGGPKGPRG